MELKMFALGTFLSSPFLHLRLPHNSVVLEWPSHVQLFVTPWTEAHQTFLSFTISQSLLERTSIESVMPSNHLCLLPPSSPFAFNLSQHQGLFK